MRTSIQLTRPASGLLVGLLISATLWATELRPEMTLEPAYSPEQGSFNYYLVSPNGQRFACAGERNGQWHMVIDGEMCRLLPRQNTCDV